MTSKDELRKKIDNISSKAALEYHLAMPNAVRGRNIIRQSVDAILNLLEGEKQSNNSKLEKEVLIEKLYAARKELEYWDKRLATLNKEPNKGEDVDG